MLTNVKISPEVSEAMLKYIAPVLAGATQSEGQFSLQLDGARVPLLDTKKTDASGQLTVHSVRVVPGPMAKQWVDLGQQIQSLVKRTDAAAADPSRQVTLLTVQDQQVNFSVADGRVYHQGMEFQIGDLTCHSDGSVGLDETVAITLRMAIPDKWVEGQPLLVGFQGAAAHDSDQRHAPAAADGSAGGGESVEAADSGRGAAGGGRRIEQGAG